MKMNPSQDLETPKVSNEEAEEPDTNANVSNDTSKGAIPKKKKRATPKQPIKFNNNIENMSTLNSDEGGKLNGISNGYLADLLEPSCSTLDGYCKYDHTKDDSSSDDLLSVSDDGCIYTYKGDQVADLPSSFFSLDIPPDVPEVSPRNQTSSPEMDYLEMDFDPGINGDADSNSENEAEVVEPPKPVIKQEAVESVVNKTPEKKELVLDVAGTSRQRTPSPTLCVEKTLEEKSIEPKINETVKEMPWSCSLSQRTKSLKFRITKRCHSTRGELVSPNENVPQIKGAAVPNQTDEIPYELQQHNFEPWMIWSKEEACSKQVTQIGPSACGATAVINVLNALRFPIPSVDKIMECVKTRLRRNESPLADYLLSRSVAGTTHEDLIEGLNKVSNGAIYARFFHMYPERIVNLYSWLMFWIKNGAVPIATLNLQRCLGIIPDAWHHQMIFGVDINGIHLCNPIECVEAGALWPQLCSESVLLVRREDVLSRWNFRTDMPELMGIRDIRWKRINVVGQVANMIHESERELRQGFTNTSHIRIPAAYSSGITLATTINSPAFSLLKHTPELPFLDVQEKNSACTNHFGTD